MSELKVASLFEFEKVLQGHSNKLFYAKSDADKVIADLEESHKMEVEQLLMEIVKLKTENIRFRKRLFRMCARLGKMGYLAFHNVQAKLEFFGDDEGVARAKMLKELWRNVERKCRAKADKFKEG